MDFPNASETFKRLNPAIFGVGGSAAAQPQHRGPVAAPKKDGNKARKQRCVVVSLVVFRRRELDDDNLVGGCKALRDAIAASLEIDDGDTARIRFEYAQVITTARTGVLVKIQP